MTSDIDGILAGYESLREGQEAPHTDLHRPPELSRAKHRTARRVAEQLQDAGRHGEGGLRAGPRRTSRLESGQLA